MIKQNYKITALIILITCLTLSGCGISKNSLGFSKQSPNEYSVLRQQPLTVPPDFDLVEPQESQQQTPTTSEKEFDEIFHGGKESVSAAENPKVTSSDKAFLNKTKQHNKKTNIKKMLSEEHKQESNKQEKERKTLFEKLFGK